MAAFLTMLLLTPVTEKTAAQQCAKKTEYRAIITSIKWDGNFPDIIVVGKVQRVGKIIPHLQGIETICLYFYDAKGKRIGTVTDIVFIPGRILLDPTKEIKFGITGEVPRGAKTASIVLGVLPETPRIAIPKRKK